METKPTSITQVTLALAFCGAIRAAAAQEGPPADRPSKGIDADVRFPLSEAEKSLKASEPAQAVRSILLLYAADNRFTVAQRPLLTPDSLRVLKAAAEKLDALGQPQKATLALDAAWMIGDQAPWPEYSQRLFGMAQKLKKAGSSAEALYLTRRAGEVDPSNREALLLDKRLSINPYQSSGKLMTRVGGALAGIGLGVSVLAASYALSNDVFSDSSPAPSGMRAVLIDGIIGGLIMAVVGGGTALTGALLVRAGKAVDGPISPEFLPALPPALTGNAIPSTSQP